jgi:putative glutamine amidotransferase
MTKSKPLIGITLDHKDNGGYSPFPWYALRENYFRVVEEAGGIPVAIPYCDEAIPTYLSLISGLLVPGGSHDIDPADYGESWCHNRVVTNTYRTRFERMIMQGALELSKPLLGICAGQQLLNVLRGGSLIQHIPDAIENCLTHEASSTPDLAVHPVKIIKGTVLFDIAGVEDIHVNSTHHQAVKEVGRGLIVNAVAPDQVIEGIEDPNKPFCLGIEWHPEYITSEIDRAIFMRFILEASRTCQ